MTDGEASRVTAREDEGERRLLRHTVATLAYRAGKAVRGTGPAFESFRVSPTSRTPGQILAHIGDLLDWALSMAEGRQRWRDSSPLPWDAEVARFFGALERLDAYLATDSPLAVSVDRVFQGPIADALTHVGQLMMLRRVAGDPVRGENYAKARIEVGRLGPDQAAERAEFD